MSRNELFTGRHGDFSLSDVDAQYLQRLPLRNHSVALRDESLHRVSDPPTPRGTRAYSLSTIAQGSAGVSGLLLEILSTAVTLRGSSSPWQEHYIREVLRYDPRSRKDVGADERT